MFTTTSNLFIEGLANKLNKTVYAPQYNVETTKFGNKNDIFDGAHQH